MGLELSVVISANINSTIAVILSPKSSLYGLQKPRYDIPIFTISRVTKSAIFELMGGVWRGWHAKVLLV